MITVFLIISVMIMIILIILIVLLITVIVMRQRARATVGRAQNYKACLSKSNSTPHAQLFNLEDRNNFSFVYRDEIGRLVYIFYKRDTKHHHNLLKIVKEVGGIL